MSLEIEGGLYLVVDPSMDQSTLINKVEQVVEHKIAAIQIWDHWLEAADKKLVIETICDLAHAREVPVIINNDWQLLNEFRLDGVHFDNIPNLEEVRKKIRGEFIVGITCNNDLAIVDWATQHKLNYLSFCSVFPSSTSNSCDLVSFDTIRKARQITSLPIFLAGGINLDNINNLKMLDFDGIAVISGIMSQDEPAQATEKYLAQLNQIV